MNRFTLIHFSIALAILVLTTGGYWLWQSQLGVVQNDISSLTTKIVGKEKTLVYARNANKDLASLESTGLTMHNYLISNGNLVAFLAELEGIGKYVDASISTMSVMPKLSTHHPMLRVSVKIIGSFGSVMRSIGAIENMPYYVVVDVITVDHAAPLTSASKKTDWTALVTLSVGSLIHTTSTK